MFITAIDADEIRVQFALASVHIPHPFLETDVLFVDVLSALQVIAVAAFPLGFELLLYKREGDVQEEVEVGAGDAEFFVLRIENPLAQAFRFLRRGRFGALVGDVGIDIAVKQDIFAGIQTPADVVGRRPPVFGKEQGYELRVYLSVLPEFPFEETGDEAPIDRGFITGEMNVVQALRQGLEIAFQAFDLRRFAGAVQSFQYNQHLFPGANPSL